MQHDASSIKQGCSCSVVISIYLLKEKKRILCVNYKSNSCVVGEDVGVRLRQLALQAASCGSPCVCVSRFALVMEICPKTHDSS